MNIMKYESKIWATADLLRGSGIKESEWPSFMMPFFCAAFDIGDNKEIEGSMKWAEHTSVGTMKIGNNL